MKTLEDALDDLLDFTDIGREHEDVKPSIILLSGVVGPSDLSRPLPRTEECEEEDLEWLSNKDSFPPIEDIDLLAGQVGSIGTDKHQSPVSVLDNSTNTATTTTCLVSSCGTLKPPHRARSKGRRKRECSSFPGIPSGAQLFWNQPNNYNKDDTIEVDRTTTTEIGRKCQHCGAEETPQWRTGPLGPKTLCNACGVRYKSGRLVPEYRPANSPTFSSKMHSNLHRKIIEMRKEKHGMGMLVKPEEDKGFPGSSGEQLFSNQTHKYSKGDRKIAKTTRTAIGKKCQRCRTEKTVQWRDGFLGKKTLCNACGAWYKSDMMGGKCRHCGTETTTQWRDGPFGKKLCNACGLRYKSEMIGRKCHHCGTEKTPQWRAGPLGKKLCSACGKRYESEMVERKCQHCGTEMTPKWFEDGSLGKKTLCSACYVMYKSEIIGGKCRHCGTETTPKWFEDGPLGKKTLCNACYVRYKSDMTARKCQHCETETTPKWWEDGPLGKKTLCNTCYVRYKSQMIVRKCQYCGTETTTKWWENGSIGKKTLCNACYDRYKSELIGRKCQHCGTETTAKWWEDGLLGKKTLCNACYGRCKSEMSGRKCQHCGAEKTPLWRDGPLGKKTLCNACGVNYMRYKNLAPEYRPASSPTFSSEMHSNVQRKIIEMRRQKHDIGIGGETEAAVIGWKCQHCGTETSLQWQDGPLGKKTLCNACSDRYKSRKLVADTGRQVPNFLKQVADK